jgi:hypothetical protein
MVDVIMDFKYSELHISEKITITFKCGTRFTASSSISIVCIDGQNLIDISVAVFDKTDISLSSPSEHRFFSKISTLFLGPLLKDPYFRN